MDHLFSPWRMKYIDEHKQESGCAFCKAQELPDGPENLILWRGENVFVILNLFPYTTGHVMVVPYVHCDQLESLNDATLSEMMFTARRLAAILKAEYHCQGINLGMNIGSAAGAGIAEHLHLHLVPRWTGDANFVSVVGQTRVIPEALEASYQRLKRAWDQFNG
jgi:ATP adenylyltransferase